jgi:sugar lactone lactonase YvrE
LFKQNIKEGKMQATQKVFRILLVTLFVLLAVGLAAGQTITTVAGGYVGDGGQATAAAFAYPEDVVVDSAGNLYISDLGNNRVRKVDTSGNITTYAGTGISGFNGDGELAVETQLAGVTGLALDSADNLYIAEQGNRRIRRVDKATGKITTVAGNGILGYSGDGGPAVDASFMNTWAVSFDAGGNMYITDIGSHVIRKVTADGTITTVAGNGHATGSLDENGEPYALGDDGSATSATLNMPRGTVVDAAGNLYIADTVNHRVRKVTPGGIITTYAGTGEPGFSEDGYAATATKIGNPRFLVLDPQGNLLIGNAGRSRIRKVDKDTGIISAFAGSGTGFNGDGNLALDTNFLSPGGLSFALEGDLLVTDSGNQRVRKINASTHVVTTIAGGYLGDGNPATEASLDVPEAITLDSSGNLYIADYYGARVRKVDTSGTIHTFAGTGFTGYDGDEGPAASAAIYFPWGVAVNSAGEVFIADEPIGVIRKVDTAGDISTWYQTDYYDLTGIVFDREDNLYVADPVYCVIRKFTPQKQESIVAGIEGSCGYDGDGVPATAARLNQPYGITFDSARNLYISDTSNNRIRKVDAKKGIITTVAGNGACEFSGDGGSATSAGLCAPQSAAVDGSGNILIADYGNARLRQVSKNGKIQTIAGDGINGFNGDNIPASSAGLLGPAAVVVDAQGNIYVADDLAGRVRKIAPVKTSGKKK